MFLKNFCYFLGGPHLCDDSFLKRILYYKKAPVNISSISNSKKPQWNLLSFASRTVVNGKQLWLSISGKTKLIFFWKKYLCFLQNIHYSQKKMFLYGKKVLYWKMFLLKKTFFTEKNINESVKNIYLIWEIYFYTENVCVTNKI